MRLRSPVQSGRFQRTSSVDHVTSAPSPAELAERGRAIISLRNIEKSYKQGVQTTYVLRRITLDFAPGEFVSIMGPSGAGKSTLLHILGMHDAAWTGEYHLHGQPVHALGKKERAELQKAAHRLRLPELSPARPPDGLREPRHAALLPRREAEGARQHGVRHARPLPDRREEGPVSRPSCPAASSSWWRWPARSSPSRR